MTQSRPRRNQDRACIDKRIDFSSEIWNSPEINGISPSYPQNRVKPIRDSKHYRGVIYKITCKNNGRSYIGQTMTAKNIRKAKDIDRLREHFYDLNSGVHPNKKLQSDWSQYGMNAFEFEVIHVAENSSFENCFDFKEYLAAKEMECIFSHNCAYNNEIVQLRLQSIAEQLGCKDPCELFASIAMGEITLTSLISGETVKANQEKISMDSVSMHLWRKKAFEKFNLSW